MAANACITKEAKGHGFFERTLPLSEVPTQFS
jgi:hypothetical protein